jgi:hypothetical protein
MPGGRQDLHRGSARRGRVIPTEGGGFLKDRKGQVVKSRLGEETLKKLAIDTGGVYLHAGGADLGLAGLYRDHVATMEKRDLESTLQRRYEHRYQIPLALGLALLVVEHLLGERGSSAPPGGGGAGARARWRREGDLAGIAHPRNGWRFWGASWIDPHATARQASRLYADGKPGEAAKYRRR